MEILLTIIHLLACFALIFIVLLQKGKGADLAGAFGGGGSQTALGVRSATQLIHKMTIAAAVFFMITSYTLGMLQSSRSGLPSLDTVAGEAQENQPADTNNKDQNGNAPNGEESKDQSGTATGGEKSEDQQPANDSNKPASDSDKTDNGSDSSGQTSENDSNDSGNN